MAVEVRFTVPDWETGHAVYRVKGHCSSETSRPVVGGIMMDEKCQTIRSRPYR